MAEDALMTAAKLTVTVHIPGRLDFLRVARHAVADLCAQARAPVTWASQLEMAVDEACANIIEHSYHHAENNPGIQISLTRYADRIEADIQDTGAGFAFDHAHPIPPDRYIEEGRSRGLGLHIIRSFVDQATYRHGTPTGNSLRLVKRLPH